MTDVNKLKAMSRRELLGVLIEAEETNNKELELTVMEVMAETQTYYGPGCKQKRGFFTKKRGNK